MTTIAPTRTTRSMPARAWTFGLASFRAIFGDIGFVVFTVAMPVLMYLIFSGIYGDQQVDGTVRPITVAAVMMITMAAYGGLGAAMAAGFSMQTDQQSGFFRQLSLTGLRPAWLLGVRAFVSSLVIVPAIVVLFLVARFAKNVTLPWEQFLGAGVVLWLALLPMVLLGLAIALWVPGKAGNSLNTIILMALSALGGLWFPIDFFPGWMQSLAKLLPSYWLGQLGAWPITGDAFPTRGLVVLLLWAVALLVLCVMGYRHAVRTARR